MSIPITVVSGSELVRNGNCRIIAKNPTNANGACPERKLSDNSEESDKRSKPGSEVIG